jgi:hypothetical protein
MKRLQPLDNLLVWKIFSESPSPSCGSIDEVVPIAEAENEAEAAMNRERSTEIRDGLQIMLQAPKEERDHLQLLNKLTYKFK